jgi:hypothetical protein
MTLNVIKTVISIITIMVIRGVKGVKILYYVSYVVINVMVNTTLMIVHITRRRERYILTDRRMDGN